MLTMTIGYMLDLLWGDPYWLPHPIVWIGNSISKLEKHLRKFVQSVSDEKRLGILLTLIIVGCSYIVTYGMVHLASFIHPYVGYFVETFLIFQILATKSLNRESRKVLVPLEKNDLLEARKYLSYIVGRETKGLKKEEIIRATIETIAENISDGIIAPLFFIFIGGAPLGMAYKAANTLDSMVGYKNKKYLHFGWASAKFDDLVNFIPARITAIYIVMGAILTGYDFKNAIKILIRDHNNHKSPNSAYPESAMAGALNIQIGGTNTYFGKKMYKPTMGDPIKALENKDIDRCIKVMYAASFVGLVSFIGLQYIIYI